MPIVTSGERADDQNRAARLFRAVPCGIRWLQPFFHTHDTPRHLTLHEKDRGYSYLPPRGIANAVASSFGKLSVDNQTRGGPKHRT